MALRMNATGSDTVSVQLDVALSEDDFMALLELLDHHPALSRLYDEQVIHRLILMGFDDPAGRPTYAGLLPIGDFQRSLVVTATVNGYLRHRDGRLSVDADRFSVAEVGAVAQKLAFGSVYYPVEEVVRG